MLDICREHFYSARFYEKCKLLSLWPQENIIEHKTDISTASKRFLNISSYSMYNFYHFSSNREQET